MRGAFGLITLTVLALSGQSFGVPAKQWNSLVLVSNQVLTAQLKYLPKASLADQDYMYVELDNRSGKNLNILQAWLGLPGTKTDKATQKSVITGDMTGGVIYSGELPPGITKANQGGVFECGLANLGLPSKGGAYVKLDAKLDLWMTDQTHYRSKPVGEQFEFEWDYPTETGLETMKGQLRDLLAHPKYEFEHGYRMKSLMDVEVVADAMSVDDLLPALASRKNSVDGRDSVVRQIAGRFSNAPPVLAYYRQGFKDPSSLVWDDCWYPGIWNPEFVEPLVARYERQGDTSALKVLAAHRQDWQGDPQYTARLRTALLKKQPILNRNIASISGDELCKWCSAINDVATLADTNFLTTLKVCLHDKRTIPDCISKTSSGGRPPWNPRVCDCALNAILAMAGGNPWEAFKRAGGGGWNTKDECYATYDKVIASLQTP
jgi:hypothetical protein